MSYTIPISPKAHKQILDEKASAELVRQRFEDERRAGTLIKEWCRDLALGLFHSSVDYVYREQVIDIAKEHMHANGWKVKTRIDPGSYHDRTIEATFTPIEDK